jgi:hypothetical protein
MKSVLAALLICVSSALQAQTISSSGVDPKTQAGPVNVAAFSGNTVGDKISNCLASLPVQGGVCDARGINGGTINGMTISNSGTSILGPCGIVNVTAPIQIYNAAGSVQGFQWEGCGYDNPAGVGVGTVFNWTAPNITITLGSQSTTVLTVTTITGTPLAVGQTVFAGAGVNMAPTQILSFGTGTGGTGTYNVDQSQTVTSQIMQAALPVFQLIGVRDSKFSNFHVNCTTNNYCAAGFQSQTQTGVGTTNNRYANVYVNGGTAGVASGWQWCTGNNCGGPGGIDANNDVNYLDNTSVSNYQWAAYNINHAQSKDHQFVHTLCNGGQYCIYNQVGSFTVLGMFGGNNSVADFYLGSADDTIVIEGINLESSNRLLVSGSGSQSWPTTIIGGRWAANNLNADNKVINYAYRGGLNIIGLSVDGTPSPRTPQFNLSLGASPAGGTAIGVATRSTSATVSTNPFTGAYPNTWRLLGNFVNDGTLVFQVPDNIGGPGVLVANLPACNTTIGGVLVYKGSIAYVTDQNTAAAYLGAVTGGGAAGWQEVQCNGTAWVQH